MSMLDYRVARAADRNRALFGQVMWLVAGTAATFALGAYLGRDLGYGLAFLFFILTFACLIGTRFAVRASAGLTTVLLFGFGLLLGLAMSTTLDYYANANPQALWQAGAATALLLAGRGAAGYATRRDLSSGARVCFWALLALIVFGVVLVLVHIPAGWLIYSILGLVIFAGVTMFDFQRLRRTSDTDSAPLIAASIFLDALNVFEFFLQLFSGRRRRS
jgi:FtsH-binding integral membrane protein